MKDAITNGRQVIFIEVLDNSLKARNGRRRLSLVLRDEPGLKKGIEKMRFCKLDVAIGNFDFSGTFVAIGKNAQGLTLELEGARVA